MVVPFQPDEIRIPDTDDDTILVQGQFRIPHGDIIPFHRKKHHLVYSKWEKTVPVTESVERSRDDDPSTAEPVAATAPSSVYDGAYAGRRTCCGGVSSMVGGSTPAAGPSASASSPLALKLFLRRQGAQGGRSM